MKKKVIWTLVALFTICGAQLTSAQENLAGRTYYNANIMAEEINKLAKESDKELDEVRTKYIDKFEKKKGRKPNDTELAEIDKQVEEGHKMMEAIKTGMKTAITVEFKTEKDVVMKADMKISEDVLKAAGISWAKRKAIKLAMAIGPSSEKGIYRVQDNLVIFEDEKEPDTLRLSDDGKFLYGKFDKKTNFKLTRTK